MIFADLEIAVHLRVMRSLDQYASGRYMLRTHIYHLDKGRPILATPINIMEAVTPPPNNQPDTYQHYYTTKSFPIKTSYDIPLNEVCLFKTSVDMNSQQYASYAQIPFHIVSELLLLENQKFNIVDTYRGILSEMQTSDYFSIDFHGPACTQIKGSIHSCIYRHHFQLKGEAINLETLCQKLGISKGEEIIQYLLQESKNSQHRISSMRALITKTIPIIREDEAEKETQCNEQIVQDAKRKRIFDSPVRKSQTKMTKRVMEMEKILHKHAQNIYQLWTGLLKGLFQKDAEQFQRNKQQEYILRLKSKNGESISRFTGAKDTDQFQNQQEQRRELAHKQRKMQKPQQFFRGFTLYNQAFFTQVRPFFFEEISAAVHSNEQSSGKVFVVLVHGLGACRYDMQKMRCELKRYYEDKIILFISSANEGRTEQKIEGLGERLAIEVDNELSRWMKPPLICMVGHSLGGLIIRSALPRLQKYKDYFSSFMTLSTPHLGFAYSTSKLVDAGLWVLSNMKKCDSLLELTMQDKEEPQNCYLYKLAQKPGIEWFKKVVFIASRQDQYAPYYSARVQKHKECLVDARARTLRGLRYCEMINNILNRVQAKLIRMDVHFCIPQNFDNMIGRAAHIRLISDHQLVRAISLAAEDLLF